MIVLDTAIAMVSFVNVQFVDRIIYSIFQRFNLDGKAAPSAYSHKQLDVIAGGGVSS